MRLMYFGADLPWPELLTEGFRRRNTWLLKCFNDSGYFDEVINVRKTTLFNFFRQLLSRKQTKKHKDLYFTHFFPGTLLKGFISRMDFVLNKLFIRLQGFDHFNDDENIIFCYWPAGFEQAMELRLKGRYFFDTDHNIIDDENLQPAKKEKQTKILLEAGEQCEFVISSARSMLDWYHNHGFDNTYFMRNGISPENFRNVKAMKQDFPAPIIGYIGTISRWIDYEVLKFLLKENPSWNFLIYGKEYKNKVSEELGRLPNCHFMGSLKPENVPSAIKSFTAGINLYRKEPWLDVDSMKLYEYLAAGTPVVSLKYHDHLDKDFDGRLFLADNAKEMNGILHDIINGKLQQKDTAQFLEKNSWKQRVKEFYEDIIRT